MDRAGTGRDRPAAGAAVSPPCRTRAGRARAHAARCADRRPDAAARGAHRAEPLGRARRPGLPAAAGRLVLAGQRRWRAAAALALLVGPCATRADQGIGTALAHRRPSRAAAAAVDARRRTGRPGHAGRGRRRRRCHAAAAPDAQLRRHRRRSAGRAGAGAVGGSLAAGALRPGAADAPASGAAAAAARPHPKAAGHTPGGGATPGRRAACAARRQASAAGTGAPAGRQPGARPEDATGGDRQPGATLAG